MSGETERLAAAADRAQDAHHRWMNAMMRLGDLRIAELERAGKVEALEAFAAKAEDSLKSTMQGIAIMESASSIEALFAPKGNDDE